MGTARIPQKNAEAIAYEIAKKIVQKHDEKQGRANNRARREANKKLVGKCFRFRNSFGSGESWWLYRKAVAIGKGTSIVVESYQVYRDGTVRIDRETFYINVFSLGSDIPISPKAFEKAKKRILARLED